MEKEMKIKLGTDLEIFSNFPASKCHPKVNGTMQQETNERKLERRKTRQDEMNWQSGKEEDEDEVILQDGEEEEKDEVGDRMKESRQRQT